ncbi:FtsX-like permease family protein [Glycomyces salinus]|uniref:FtsX-like permease family protein n=1 Tax=Glycomyces salinus TaxID=980294 RepID=UPI0018EA6A1E|nr:FtsX-like permease family protein [Glycomyces salinus]
MKRAILREAAASARSQMVASGLTFAVVAGMCIAVLLTTGRTVAAEEAALEAIDAAGTRSITVRSSDTRSLTAGLLDRLVTIDGIESLAGFGPVTDVRNAHVPDGEPVPSRTAFGELGGHRLIELDGVPNAAIASDVASETLRLRDGVGAVTNADGFELEVIGSIAIPEHLGFMDRIVVVPSSTEEALAGTTPDAPISLLVVQADSPGQVEALTEVLREYLSDADLQAVSIETSAELAAVRSAVSGELGQYGRTTVLGILAVSALVIGINILALAIMRRKDFGRRRALGARRSLIIALLLAQVGITAGMGAVTASVATTMISAMLNSPFPGWGFTSAVAALGTLCAMAAAMPPAVYAARREPLHELRVP